jgi:hypothetical protein
MSALVDITFLCHEPVTGATGKLSEQEEVVFRDNTVIVTGSCC